MKGVILAGGLGTRLYPLTKITNKHLLPVYDKPMVVYSIETLRRSGLNEIMIVCGREHSGHFMNFLGSGKEYGVKLSYALQDKNNAGIADALLSAEDFADRNSVAVILGDNIFENDFSKAIQKFDTGAMVFFKKVPDPERFGVAVFDKSGKKLINIEEKPKIPKSEYAQTGFYLYDFNIFSYIKKLKPSGRGELEITDANNMYLKRGELGFAFVSGLWLDVGMFDSLLEASNIMAKKGKKHAKSS
ncbi:MAG: sugar phosphate nucleotidyltransferase [bacterium]|nr:sugar phosphate nucleotidyltransferase [bacterium]